MIGIRRSQDRAFYDHGTSSHFYTFSFGDYDDPAHRGFGPLTVINEDRLAGGKGFPMHPHKEIELVTFVISGCVRYKDTLGTSVLLEAGDFQRATCGAGIEHSVYNHSEDDELRVLQCWVKPHTPGLAPSVDHWEAADSARRNHWALVASPGGRDGSMHIHRDADVLTARLDEGAELEYLLRPGRHAWMQVTQGALAVNGEAVEAGDGVAVSAERGVWLEGRRPCEVLLFDLGA